MQGGAGIRNKIDQRQRALDECERMVFMNNGLDRIGWSTPMNTKSNIVKRRIQQGNINTLFQQISGVLRNAANGEIKRDIGMLSHIVGDDWMKIHIQHAFADADIYMPALGTVDLLELGVKAVQ